MAKKAKLKLEQLRVESFLTQLTTEKKELIKGGCYETDCRSGCPIIYSYTKSLNPIFCCDRTP
jgi:hypothetical protein